MYTCSSKPRGRRHGYMGHLIRIANSVARSGDNDEQVCTLNVHLNQYGMKGRKLGFIDGKSQSTHPLLLYEGLASLGSFPLSLSISI